MADPSAPGSLLPRLFPRSDKARGREAWSLSGGSFADLGAIDYQCPGASFNAPALLARHSPASHFHGADKGKNIMLFIGHWRISPGNRNAVIERFAKTGGQPPKGIKMLGRWHDVANGTGISISETDDASAMARWVLEWSDLMEMEVHPALNDEQLGALLAGLQKSK